MIQGNLVLPKALDDHASLFKRFSSTCHSVSLTMLSCLSDALQLDGDSRFERNHSDEKPNDTGLKLLSDTTKSRRADATDNTHRDTGTLTLVFTTDWAIMLEHPETKTWAFAEPKPGCALVNVADSLQSLSGNKLHSCRHRVTQASDGEEKRYFIAYFLRPDRFI
jgi:isopenicillin N synthase-like dioxygenase